MSGEPMPPPGAERDAEIARLLDPGEAAIRDYIAAPQRPTPATRRRAPLYSTDPAACDRLVEEMVRRGWKHRLEVEAPPKPDGPWYCAHFFRSYDYDLMHNLYSENGTTRPDAVSAAALLALRGAT